MSKGILHERLIFIENRKCQSVALIRPLKQWIPNEYGGWTRILHIEGVSIAGEPGPVAREVNSI